MLVRYLLEYLYIVIENNIYIIIFLVIKLYWSSQLKAVSSVIIFSKEKKLNILICEIEFSFLEISKLFCDFVIKIGYIHDQVVFNADSLS